MLFWTFSCCWERMRFPACYVCTAPGGEAFWWVDVARFRPLALVYAAAIILIYIAQGEYRTFKRRGLVRELAKAFWETWAALRWQQPFCMYSNFAVFPPAACLLLPAVQRGHYGQAVIAAPDQPLVCKAAPYYSRVLLVGNGNLALRYYNDVVKGKDVSAEYAGYAAQNPVVNCRITLAQ